MCRQFFFLAFAIFAMPLCVATSTAAGQTSKRGVAGNSVLRGNALNSDWHYRWHYLEPDGVYNDSQWSPMFFGAGSDANVNNRIDYLLQRQDQFDHVLGFNEPERTDQGNTSVARAIEAWEIIDDRMGGSTGLKLVSPAVSDDTNGRAWLSDFMAQVDANNLQVDAIAFHWYGSVTPSDPIGAAEAFLAKVDAYHEQYQRPIWITEFAGHDWNDQYTDEAMQQANATFLEHAIPGLESRAHVERYAWFQTSPTSSTPREEGLLVTEDSHGLLRPTLAGKAYMPNEVLLAGETLDLDGQSKGNVYYYMQGGAITNDGSVLGDDSVGGLYVMSNDDGSLRASTLTGSSDWGLTPDAFVRIENNATLRKTGTNTVSWNDVNLYIDGQVRLFGGDGNEGTLSIGYAEVADGDGFFRLDDGSHLHVGSVSNSIGFALPYDMQLRGGRVSASGVGAELTGDLTLFESTEISVTGIQDQLIISGDFIANPGGRETGINKLGDGMLVLSGDNSFVGSVFVNEGTLSIDARTDAQLVRVAENAALQGVGIVESDVRVFGNLAPGNSIGNLTADSVSLFAGSTLTMEIGSTSSYDELVVLNELFFDPEAMLELVLVDGFEASVGDEFQILSFGSFSGDVLLVSSSDNSVGRWDTSSLGSDGFLRFVAVPEPQSASVILLAGMLFARCRRRNVSETTSV